MKSYDKLLKFIIIGNSDAGKTSVLLRYFDEGFSHSTMSTIGIDFKMKTISYPLKNGKTIKIKIQIWDTAGSERFRSATNSFYRNSNGIILVYDVNSRESFAGIKKWMTDANLHCDQEFFSVIVGNKIDVGGKLVETAELKDLAESYKNCQWRECSAKDDIGVTEIFENLIASILSQDESELQSEKSTTSNLTIECVNKNKCCI